MDVEKFIDELPKAQFMQALELRKWEGYWFVPPLLKETMKFRSSFEARDDDVFLASTTKTGTTWLKSLAFCIFNRQQQKHQTLDALTTESPHFLVPTVEAAHYTKRPLPFDAYDASGEARLLHTHLPHVLLPDSVKGSYCKIVYVVRNPKDTVISSWHFYNSFVRKDQDPFPLEKFVDSFCTGMDPYGPFVEHVAEYWEESKKRPEKLLFLKYEELKREPTKQVMKIAEFLGKPFENEEEADEIVGRCSIERLKNLEVNKSGSHFITTTNSSFFRKGEVGDSKNYLTPEMKMQIDQTISVKLEALGLYF